MVGNNFTSLGHNVCSSVRIAMKLCMAQDNLTWGTPFCKGEGVSKHSPSFAIDWHWTFVTWHLTSAHKPKIMTEMIFDMSQTWTRTLVEHQKHLGHSSWWEERGAKHSPSNEETRSLDMIKTEPAQNNEDARHETQHMTQHTRFTKQGIIKINKTP